MRWRHTSGRARTGVPGLVLLGDPQQLTQPTKAVHPTAAASRRWSMSSAGPRRCPRGRASSSTHLAAPPADRRLVSALFATTGSSPPRGGSGSRSTPRRPDRVRAALGAGPAYRLLDRVPGRGRGGHCSSRTCSPGRGPTTRTTRRRSPRPTSSSRAPFNAQVGLLRRVLPDGVRAGTVDKFQGQQAPVVPLLAHGQLGGRGAAGVGFSTTSTGSMLRSPGPGADRHRRLTGAARGLRVEPEQLRMVNALCRFADEAQLVDLRAGAAQSS